MYHRPRFLAVTITWIAALTLLVPACKSEKPAESDESKEEAAEVVPELGEVAVAEKGVAAPPVSALVAPGKVSIDQAIAVMGRGAQHRLELRTKPLVDSGLVEMAIGAMPAKERSEYEKFVAESGFEPAKRFAGLLLYADGDLQALERSGATIILGIEGGISEQLLTYLDGMDDDDEEDDDTDEDEGFWSLVVLAELPTGVQTKFLEKLAEDEAEEEQKSERRALDTATYLAKPDGDGVKYLFIWSGGLVMGRVAADGKPTLEVPERALKQILGELAAAASADPSASTVAIAGRGDAEGVSAKFTLTLASKLVLDMSATLPVELRAQTKQLVAAFPEMKKSPAILLSEAPPIFHALATMFIEGTHIQAEGDTVLARVQVDLTEMKAALEPILKAFGG